MTWERDAAGNIIRDAVGNPVSDADGPEPGSICWGHTASIEESIWKPFITNWTGDGVVTGSVDAEAIELSPGEHMISETWETTAGYIVITTNEYREGESTPTIEYKTGASASSCESDVWNAYSSGKFNCLGWAKIKVSRPS